MKDFALQACISFALHVPWTGTIEVPVRFWLVLVTSIGDVSRSSLELMKLVYIFQLPKNSSCLGLAAGLVDAWKHYGKEKYTCQLFY